MLREYASAPAQGDGEVHLSGMSRGGDGESLHKGDAVVAPTSLARSLGACALYGTTSVTITFFNKAVFSVYGFHFPCFVTLVQILICIAGLSAASLAGM